MRCPTRLPQQSDGRHVPHRGGYSRVTIAVAVIRQHVKATVARISCIMDGSGFQTVPDVLTLRGVCVLCAFMTLATNGEVMARSREL